MHFKNYKHKIGDLIYYVPETDENDIAEFGIITSISKDNKEKPYSVNWVISGIGPISFSTNEITGFKRALERAIKNEQEQSK
jgi:hypothetical protein